MAEKIKGMFRSLETGSTIILGLSTLYVVAGGILAFSVNSLQVLWKLVLLGIVLLVALLAYTVWRTHLMAQTVSQARDSSTQNKIALNSLSQSVVKLESHVESIFNSPLIDWTTDAEEHYHNAYNRISDTVADKRTASFKVLTIFRDQADVGSADINKHTRDAMRRYYSLIEESLATRRGFVYKRVVVLRRRVGDLTEDAMLADPNHLHRVSRDLLRNVFRARPDFLAHYRNIETANTAAGATGSVNFFVDTGRLLDVAFAVASSASGNPLWMVIEIGTTKIDASLHQARDALGLLRVANPPLQPSDAFLHAHETIARGHLVLRCPEEAIQEAARDLS